MFAALPLGLCRGTWFEVAVTPNSLHERYHMLSLQQHQQQVNLAVSLKGPLSSGKTYQILLHATELVKPSIDTRDLTSISSEQTQLFRNIHCTLTTPRSDHEGHDILCSVL